MNQKKIQESILVPWTKHDSRSRLLSYPCRSYPRIFIPAIKHNYYLQRNFIGRPIRDKNFLFNSVFWPVYFIIVPLDSLESTKKKYEWRGGVIDEADRTGTKGNYEFPGELSGIKYYTLSPMNNLIEVEISPRAGGKHQFIFDLNFK